MRTFQTTVYEYDELTPAAQSKARDWFRDVSAGDTYDASLVIEDAIEVLRIMGVTLDSGRIQWSGFNCQGDGASFTGGYARNANAPAEIRAYAPTDKTLHTIADTLARIECAPVTIGRQGCSYVHELSVWLTYEGESIPDAEWLEVKEALRSLMRWIHEQIESSYEYDQSDDVIAETIRANEYTFTATGKREG